MITVRNNHRKGPDSGIGPWIRRYGMEKPREG